jgi:hypothetical protein
MERHQDRADTPAAIAAELGAHVFALATMAPPGPSQLLLSPAGLRNGLTSCR